MGGTAGASGVSIDWTGGYEGEFWINASGEIVIRLVNEDVGQCNANDPAGGGQHYYVFTVFYYARW